MDQVRPQTVATAPLRPLLDRVPTQRGPHRLEPRPTAVGGRPAVVVLVLALLGGSGGVAQLTGAAGWAGGGAPAVGVADAQAAADGDAAAAGTQQAAQGDAAGRAARTDVVVAAGAALDRATTVLDGSPDADPALRGQLQAAIAALGAGRGGPASARELRGLTQAVTVATAQVEQGESAWRAEQQAATSQAPPVAAPGSAQQGSAGTGDGVSQAARIGAEGKVCTGQGIGAGEVSGAEIAQQINIYRISNGMSPLSVSRSPALVSHAVDMADAGGIWHSGHDNIVGCVSDGSATSLVTAWSASPPHNAQMLRGDVTTMAVGAAVREGWLYGAVVFS